MGRGSNRQAHPSWSIGVVGTQCRKAYSGFTHVTACRITRPPTAAFVTRLRPGQLPATPLVSYQALPTTAWVDPSSTGQPRRWGAPRNAGSRPARLKRPVDATNRYSARPRAGHHLRNVLSDQASPMWLRQSLERGGEPPANHRGNQGLALKPRRTTWRLNRSG